MNSVLHKTLDHIIWIGPGKLNEIPEWLSDTKRFTMYEANGSFSAYLEQKYSVLKNISVLNSIIGSDENTNFYQYNEPYFDGLSSPDKLKNRFPGLVLVSKEQTHLSLKNIIKNIESVNNVGLIIDFLDDEFLLINSLKENELAESFNMISIRTSIDVNVAEELIKQNFCFINSSKDRFGNITSTFIRNPLYLKNRHDEVHLFEQCKNNQILTENLADIEEQLNENRDKQAIYSKKNENNEKLISTLREKLIDFEYLLQKSERNFRDADNKNSELSEELHQVQHYKNQNKNWAESLVEKCKNLEQKLKSEEIKKDEKTKILSSLNTQYETLKSEFDEKCELIVEHESKSNSMLEKLEEDTKKIHELTQLSIEYKKSLSLLDDKNKSQLQTITELKEALSTSDKTLTLNIKLMAKLQIDSDDLRKQISLVNQSEKQKTELINQLYNKLQNAATFMKYLRENHPTVLDEFE
tara:strand:- start:6562 stop:7968 length:1407 start_codon:yes stop_codon:yes gene_type:complete